VGRDKGGAVDTADRRSAPELRAYWRRRTTRRLRAEQREAASGILMRQAERDAADVWLRPPPASACSSALVIKPNSTTGRRAQRRDFGGTSRHPQPSALAVSLSPQLLATSY